MARDGLLFKGIAHVHPKYRTPDVALFVSSIWAIILAISGTYEQLFSWIVVSEWLFYALATLSVIILRHKFPTMERPFKVPGYPFVPIIAVLTFLVLMINALIGDPINSFIGLGLVAAGIPIYFVMKKLNANKAVVNTEIVKVD